MIDRNFCIDELDRLAHLRGFPETPRAMDDLIEALQVSPTEDDARKLMDDIVSSLTAGQQCPTAGDIRRIAWERRDEENKKREAEYKQWKRDKKHPTEFMTGKGWDQEFLRLYKVRLEELRDPLLARFYPDEHGRLYRTPTDTSRALSACVYRMSGSWPAWDPEHKVGIKDEDR